MKRPVWKNGVLELEDREEPESRAPIATSQRTVEGAVPVPNPVMDRQLVMDEAEGKASSVDEALICFYKCDCGRYLTDSMIAMGICAGHFMRYAVSMSDEEAEDLAQQLEAISLDTVLNENEVVLLKVIRMKLAERWM